MDIVVCDFCKDLEDPQDSNTKISYRSCLCLCCNQCNADSETDPNLKEICVNCKKPYNNDITFNIPTLIYSNPIIEDISNLFKKCNSIKLIVDNLVTLHNKNEDNDCRLSFVSQFFYQVYKANNIVINILRKKNMDIINKAKKIVEITFESLVSLSSIPVCSQKKHLEILDKNLETISKNIEPIPRYSNYSNYISLSGTRIIDIFSVYTTEQVTCLLVKFNHPPIALYVIGKDEPKVIFPMDKISIGGDYFFILDNLVIKASMVNEFTFTDANVYMAQDIESKNWKLVKEYENYLKQHSCFNTYIPPPGIIPPDKNLDIMQWNAGFYNTKFSGIRYDPSWFTQLRRCNDPQMFRVNGGLYVYGNIGNYGGTIEYLSPPSQQSFKECVNELLSKKSELSLKQTLEEIVISELSDKCKSLLTNYSSKTYIHKELNMTFGELLVTVWDRIRINPYKLSILISLSKAIPDALCFTELFIDLVNSLSGFVPEVKNRF